MSYTQEQIDYLIRLKTAHGTLAGVAFGLLMPVAAIVVATKPSLVWVHAGMQIVALVFWIAAFGMGTHLAVYIGCITDYHPIIGIVLFPLSFIQLVTGWFHHSNAKKLQKRTWISYVHLWFGRAVVTLGMINVGFGLYLASTFAPYDLYKFRTGWITYGVLAGILWGVWMYLAGKKDLAKARAYNESVYGKSSEASSSPARSEMAEA